MSKGAVFKKWIANAARGDRRVYWHGFLAHDRTNSFIRKDAIEVSAIALEAQSSGLIHVVQKRIAEDCYDYIAVKR